MAGRFTKGNLTFSMIVGTVLIPLSAMAAIWLTGPADSGEEAAVTTTSIVRVATVPPEATAGRVTQADLQTACGPEGMQLASLEEQGTISDVQQAALDALRDLCDQHGIPLPAKPVSEPIVQTVVVPAASTPTTVAATTATTNDDDHHEYEDGDHDEYEDDGDHDEDDSHEEGDHEEDDHDEDGD